MAQKIYQNKQIWLLIGNTAIYVWAFIEEKSIAVVIGGFLTSLVIGFWLKFYQYLFTKKLPLIDSFYDKIINRLIDNVPLRRKKIVKTILSLQRYTGYCIYWIFYFTILYITAIQKIIH